MKNIFLSVIVILGFLPETHAQLNEYKYIVVPKKFEGFKKENQYKTSTLIKHLFAKKGFNAIYDDALPTDLRVDGCLGLYAQLLDESSMFTTKATIVLKDCSDQEVFSTVQGKSKQKEYQASFSEAINDAFQSFEGVVYNYQPKQKTEKEEPITVSFKNDVKKIEERPNLEKNQDKLVEQIATEEVQYYKDRSPIESNYKKADTTPEKKLVEQVATKEEQRFETIEPSSSTYQKAQVGVNSSAFKSAVKEVLYAQELSNGYQLVDSSPQVIMKLLKTSSPNVFIAEMGGTKGVVYANAGQWVLEYYEVTELITEELNVKF